MAIARVYVLGLPGTPYGAQSEYVCPMPSLWFAVHMPAVQQGVPAHTVTSDSQPSSGLGAWGKLQLPQPGAHVEVQRPPLHASVCVLAALHARQPPQALVVVSFVSHPVEGLPEQFV
jgi:hypothetical protein